MTSPRFGTKLFFWLILGVLSTFFAEVLSGSTPYPFIPIQGAWGLLMVMPLYTFHTLVFVTLVYRYGNPVFHTLFLAGALFGMYEAYATGVLWAGWDTAPPLALFEVGVIETLVLVFFWHPLLAFILPVIFAETFLTASAQTRASMQRFTSFRALILLAVLFGFFQSLNMGSPQMALLVAALSIPVVAVFVYLWRRGDAGSHRMQALLPNTLQFRVIFGLMLAQYALLGMISLPKYPGLPGHIAVLALYGVLILLFVQSLRRSRGQTLPDHPTTWSWRQFFMLSVVFTASAAFFSAWIAAFQPFVWIVVLLFYSFAGLVSLFIALMQMVRRTG